MRKRTLATAISSALLLTVSPAAWNAEEQAETKREWQQGQQASPQQTAPDFSELDRNQDDSLNYDEANRVFSSKEEFATADSDGDGKLSKDEYQAAVKQQAEKSAMQQQGEQEGAQITVEQKEAKIQVEQPAPEVIVKQPQPDVTIKQPEPEVSVKQPEPEVTVQPQQPEVEVEQQKPEVTVKTQEQPEVEIQQVEESEEMKQQESKTKMDKSLQQMKVGEVVGRQVVNSQGQELGEIQKIVLSNDKQLYAVVSVGGFLGMGDEEVAIPFDELELRDQEVLFTTDMSEEELEEQANTYDAAKYQELQEDQKLSEFMSSKTATEKKVEKQQQKSQ